MTPIRKGSRQGQRIRGGRPSSPVKSVVRRKAAPNTSRRGGSEHLKAQRDLRRQQSRTKAASVTKTLRPAVRPNVAPSRVLPSARPAAAGPVRPRRQVRPSPHMIKKGLARPAGGGFAKPLRGGAFLTLLSAASAPPELSMGVSSLQSSLDSLQEKASFTELQADIANLDSNLHHALNLLESARDQGYRYQKDLESIAYDAMSRWQDISEGIESNIQAQAALFQSSLDPVDASVQKLNAVLSRGGVNTSVLGSVQREVDRVLRNLNDAENAIEKGYSSIESQAGQLTSRLTRIHWVLKQLSEASFELDDKENIYMAVKARWDQEGKDDPEGVLYLTNKRLILERKEKMSTKKILFVTTASELVQEVLFSSPLGEVTDLKAHNKGLFGHQDFLDAKVSGKMMVLHLDGQDSNEWARMIKDANSGKIEEDLATDAGISFADLTGKITEADIMELQQEVNELQEEMMLKVVQEELSELENDLNSLDRDLKDLRVRGYVVEKNLEADIEVLTLQWEKIKQRAKTTLEYQTNQLGAQMKLITASMGVVAGMSGDLENARPKFIQVKSEVASAEAQSEAAEATVLDQYDEFADEIESLNSHMEWVDWMLDALETASFKLLATESGVAAVDAVWERPGVEPQNGILYLTDQRLVWEDRQGEFEVKLEVPVAQIEDVKEEEDKETGEESLVFDFSSAAPVNKARFSLGLPVGDSWVQTVGRVRSGGFADDRTVEIDKSELDRIRNAPEQCSNCGAAFTAPILRGQNEITCEFCGVVTRI